MKKHGKDIKRKTILKDTNKNSIKKTQTQTFWIWRTQKPVKLKKHTNEKKEKKQTKKVFKTDGFRVKNHQQKEGLKLKWE